MTPTFRNNARSASLLSKTHALACVLCLGAFVLISNGCDDASAPDLTDARTVTELNAIRDFDESGVEDFLVTLRGDIDNREQNFNNIEFQAQLNSAPDVPELDIDLTARRTPASGTTEFPRPGNPEEWVLNSLTIRCKQIPTDGTPVILTEDPRVVDDRAAGFEFEVITPGPPERRFVYPSRVNPVEECELRVSYEEASRTLEMELISSTRQILPLATLPFTSVLSLTTVLPERE